MNVTMRQLKVFEAVARNLSFTRASEELYLTQPAVSMQIKQLEDSIGLPLFEQLGKRIFLTEAGREMTRYSNAVLQQIKEAEEVFAELKGLKRGRLDIAAVTSANSFTSQVLAAFRARYSNISANIRVSNRQQVLEQLKNNEVDLAIMGRPPQNLDLKRTAFMENPLVLVAAADHPLASARHIPLDALRQEVFLVREEGSGTRIAMERFFAQHGVRLKSEIVMSSNESIKEAIQAGLGLGVVSLHTILLELETRRLVVLNAEKFPIKTYWYVVHRADKRFTAVVQSFRDFVIDEASQFVFHRLPHNYFRTAPAPGQPPVAVHPPVEPLLVPGVRRAGAA
jgi:LysR family transcriptional regulator, low CO2-responsive transcriptional regulator